MEGLKAKSARFRIFVFMLILSVSLCAKVGTVYGDYSVTIWAWDAFDYNGWIAEPISMDGTPTGFSTPHTFTVNGDHYFSVPTVDVNGRQFGAWDSNPEETYTSIWVSSSGTHTAQYGVYPVRIEAWDPYGGVWQQVAEPITMDGTPTGYSTPHTFTELNGTHTFAVPDTDVNGYPFNCWHIWAGASYSQPYAVDTGGIHDVTYMQNVTCSVTPSSWTMNLGQSKLFTLSASGGSGVFPDYWWLSDTGGSGGNAWSYTYTPTSTGPHSIKAIVDMTSRWPNAFFQYQVDVPVTVNPTLVSPSVYASLGVIDQGQTSVLSNSSVINTGTSPYSYQWYSLSPGDSSYSVVSGATGLSYSFITSGSSPPVTAAGTWNFILQVTDNTGASVNSTVSVIVNTAPTVAVSPGSADVYVGNVTLFTATPSGGSGTYTSYQWYVDGAAQSGETVSTFNYVADTEGTHSITVTVIDDLGVASPQSDPATVTVILAIPDFASWLFLPFLMSTTLAAIALKKRFRK